MKEKIRKYPHLAQSYDEFCEFLDSKGVLEQCAVETLSWQKELTPTRTIWHK